MNGKGHCNAIHNHQCAVFNRILVEYSMQIMRRGTRRMINKLQMQMFCVQKFVSGLTHCVDYVTESVAYLIRFDLAITFSINFN